MNIKYPLFSLLFVVQTACFAGGQPMNNGHPRSLKACPTSPNCVSSQAEPSDKDHYIEPWQGFGSLEHNRQQLLALLSTMGNCQVVDQDDNYVHAIFTTRWLRFVDDVEFLIDAEQIQLRSGSRTGYSDFGVNRKRLERLGQLWRKALRDSTVTQPND